MKFKNISLVGLFCALLAIGAYITVPAPIPFTMQTFILFLMPFVIGIKSSVTAVVIYLSVGFLGLPVFSGFHGGVSVLFGAGGGYLLAFVFIPVMMGVFKNKVFGAVLGLLGVYTFGTLWFLFVYGEKSVAVAVTVCVLPFVLPDLLKLYLAYKISKKIP